MSCGMGSGVDAATVAGAVKVAPVRPNICDVAVDGHRFHSLEVMCSKPCYKRVGLSCHTPVTATSGGRLDGPPPP
jgi:hypothetical protein